ncbi:hypothetical protein FSP39_021738 [Pinctada imbricata]|uniref:Phosphatidylinositol-glycan-specific phospholipase D n=1 Tax=Pinctada imbricata TaxID=66713 RepID=A0AA88XQ66_PINIB|nr:hypothetical protein FSP39_021738 [Pinctada imbricata]
MMHLEQNHDQRTENQRSKDGDPPRSGYHHESLLLDKHEDAFLGGAPYPDTFYNPLCYGGAYHNISEDTHWTPFLNASINYINKQPKPWSDATEKLVVFIMSVTSHQVADIVWHSLGIDQGFLSTMGFLFQEIADKSPFLVDNLQIYFLGGMEDMAGWTFRKWHDVANMLEKGTSACNLPHNPLYINCTKQLNPLYQGEDRAETNGYFRQPRLNGLTIKDLDIKDAHRGIVIKPGAKLKQRISARRKIVKNKKDKLKNKWKGENKNKIRNLKINYNVNMTEALFGWSLTKGDFDKDGNEDLVIGAPFYGEDENPYMGRVFVVYSSERGLPSDYLEYVYTTTNLNNLTLGFNRILSGPPAKQSRFGFSLTVLDMNEDGILDLAVGAPSFSSDDPLSYNMKYCNLGYSLSTADVNGDGHEDLIIGSPYWSRSKDFPQNGFITAVPSDKTYSGSMTIAVEKMKWGIIGDQPYGWFGHNLYSKGGVLFVDQPYYRKCDNPTKFSTNDTQSVGRLHILNFGTKYHLPKNITVVGKNRFDMLSSASDIGDPFANRSLVLAVGAPGAAVDAVVLTLPWKLSQGGSVILYRIDPDGKMTQIAKYSGDRRFTRFGDLVLTQLVLSASRNTDTGYKPYYLGSGKVYVFNLKWNI